MKSRKPASSFIGRLTVDTSWVVGQAVNVGTIFGLLVQPIHGDDSLV